MIEKQTIDKLGLLCIKDNRLLVARSKGKDTFYIPGGKREAGENDQQALIREIKEELSVDLIPSSIKFVESFTTQAHGQAEGVQVKITCYGADFSGEIKANAEIEEIAWLSYDEKAKCSIATQRIMDWLQSNNMLTSTKIASNQINKLCLYEWIVFDADDTLFHFDAFKGLRLMFTQYGVEFTSQHYEQYQLVNKSLWVEYQNNSITAQQLQHRRFDRWANTLQKSPQELNSAFLSAMAEICTPLDGAVSLLNSLKGKVKLGIITNGFTELQRVRLERTGLKDHFHFVVISEQVGVAKPHRRIFDHALSMMGNPPGERVLMVGDNPESDILGGINAGLHTCWFNAHKKSVAENITPTYQVTSHNELERLLLSEQQLSNATLSWRQYASNATPVMWKPPAAVITNPAAVTNTTALSAPAFLPDRP